MRPLLVAALAAGLWMPEAGCHRLARASSRAPLPLAGLELPLGPGPALAVRGTLGGRAIEVRLETARALSSISEPCLPEGWPARVGATVHVPLAAGGFEAIPELLLRGLAVGTAPLPPLPAGVWRGPGPCAVTLGADVLSGYALRVDPRGRRLRFEPSRAPAEYAAWASLATEPGRRFVVEVAQDPKTDFPLVPLQLKARGGTWVAPLFISTSLPRSVLSAWGARQAPLASDAGPDGGRRCWDAESAELAPGLALGPLTFDVAPRWGATGAAGMLAPGALDAFTWILDLRAGRLALERLAPASPAAGRAGSCQPWPAEAPGRAGAGPPALEPEPEPPDP